jgi:hypothetical protein
MFAPMLMDVLAGLLWKGQLPHSQYLDMTQRFASLRSYGLLPMGRERRAQRLSQQEIANAVLGLAASSPEWAGHVALILSKLRPIGGEQQSYDGARTLQEAVAKLLTQPTIPSAFRRLELSCSEYWTNAVGLGALECEFEGRCRTIYFVPLSWSSDNYAIMQGGWSGNPIPVPVPKRDLSFTTVSHWIFDRNIPSSIEIRRALALYREARNAHHNFLVGYAIVSYCKVIEISNPYPHVKEWIKKNFTLAQADAQFARVAAEFDRTRGSMTPEEYLWTSCRVATAHGSPKKVKSDPDDSEEANRLSIAADVFHILARIFVSKDLGVSVSQYSGD